MSVSCIDYLKVAMPSMEYVPEGEFLMGSTDPDASPYELPIHRVRIRRFEIDRTPITNVQFASFVAGASYVSTAERKAADGGEAATWRDHAGEGREHHPVVCVSWHDAVAFCHWRSEMSGRLFLLPTEAQWEYAGRGGMEQKLFPWGDETPRPDTNACWHRWMEDIGTLPVASFAPNGYGLHDMAGNVWEWCMDWYDNDYYKECAQQGTVSDPTGPTSGAFKTRRGAAWNIGEPFRMRCANRGAMPPEKYWPNLGFRCISVSAVK